MTDAKDATTRILVEDMRVAFESVRDKRDDCRYHVVSQEVYDYIKSIGGLPYYRVVPARQCRRTP